MGARGPPGTAGSPVSLFLVLYYTMFLFFSSNIKVLSVVSKPPVAYYPSSISRFDI